MVLRSLPFVSPGCCCCERLSILQASRSCMFRGSVVFFFFSHPPPFTELRGKKCFGERGVEKKMGEEHPVRKKKTDKKKEVQVTLGDESYARTQHHSDHRGKKLVDSLSLSQSIFDVRRDRWRWYGTPSRKSGTIRVAELLGDRHAGENSVLTTAT